MRDEGRGLHAPFVSHGSFPSTLIFIIGKENPVHMSLVPLLLLSVLCLIRFGAARLLLRVFRSTEASSNESGPDCSSAADRTAAEKTPRIAFCSFKEMQSYALLHPCLRPRDMDDRYTRTVGIYDLQLSVHG